MEVACARYEEGMQKMEERMELALKKEAQRREAAELALRGCKQRVKNLEFLVSELRGDGSDDDDASESDDSDED